MKFTTLILAAIVACTATLAEARNTPCSGKKGGVVGCTAGGKFMCANGTTSASKQQCNR
ncbi:hypothetical protein [Rhizobium oryzicola]|uniref:Transmembrane anchored protein n=1 Tax=Rhizobium oryzicola TaxID=1232668 RepID=A0ABT8SVW5_9HYPH|nr:hypothetical protein [Rhizobium oryzicola]MDO1582440.1 hypothetical protein [Rhizobium oryzicola]